MTPDPALVLPQQRRYRTSHWKLFDTLTTARIWPRLTSGCLQLNGVRVTCDEAVQELREMVQSRAWAVEQRRARKACSALAALCRTRRSYVEQWAAEPKYTLWAAFCVSIDFNTLSCTKDTNMEASLSEHPLLLCCTVWRCEYSKVRYCVHRCTVLGPVVSEMDQMHI
jgi:hypothetical protein